MSQVDNLGDIDKSAFLCIVYMFVYICRFSNHACNISYEYKINLNINFYINFKLSKYSSKYSIKRVLKPNPLRVSQ